MSVIYRPDSSNGKAYKRSVSHAYTREKAAGEDEYVELSNTAVMIVGAVFWAFVGMLTGAWLHI